MAKRGGYIKLFRALAASEMWTKEPFTRGQAWVDLLLLANYAPGHIRVRGNRIEVARGQVGWSAEALAKRWMWSRGKVDRFLKELQIEQQIEQQKSFLSTVLTITNYDRYQKRRAAERKADGQQTDSRTDVENSTSVRVGRKKRTADGQQNFTEQSSTDRELLSGNSSETDSRRTADDTADGHQNGALYKKNLKKKKEEERESARTQKSGVPTIEDVAAYVKELGYTMDPEKFWHHFETRGWRTREGPIKSWKSAVVNWQKNERAFGARNGNSSRTGGGSHRHSSDRGDSTPAAASEARRAAAAQASRLAGSRGPTATTGRTASGSTGATLFPTGGPEEGGREAGGTLES